MDSAPLPDEPLPGRPPHRKSVALAGVLGWVMPGFGHLYVGQPLKALLFFAAIVPTFALGLALTDYTCVNPQKYTLEFVAHAWLGGPTALALHWTKDLLLESMPRWFDVGRLYAAVAGLLNVVALSDVVGVAIERNRLVERLRRHAAHAMAVRSETWGAEEPQILEDEPAIVEIDGEDTLFDAVGGPPAANGPAAPSERPAVSGEPILEPPPPAEPSRAEPSRSEPPGDAGEIR